MYLNWHTKLNQGRDEQTKLLEIVNKYNTVAEYKIKVQKSTNNDISKKKKWKKNNFFCNCNKNKYQGINLTKDVDKLYTIYLIMQSQMIIKRDWKRQNEMERYSMFMDWKNEHG